MRDGRAGAAPQREETRGDLDLTPARPHRHKELEKLQRRATETRQKMKEDTGSGHLGFNV